VIIVTPHYSFAATSADFYEKRLAWILPARNIFCKVEVVKQRDVGLLSWFRLDMRGYIILAIPTL
jgi:hypothetical protein